MTPKEQAAMQQALEALEHYGIEGTKSVGGIKCTAAITALREALAEPQIKSDNYLSGYCIGRTDLLTEQAEYEPVAWISGGGILTSEKWQAEEWIDYGGTATPLYTVQPSSKPVVNEVAIGTAAQLFDDYVLAKSGLDSSTLIYTTPPTAPNLNCKSVQKRLATSWGYVLPEQQEPVDGIRRKALLIIGEVWDHETNIDDALDEIDSFYASPPTAAQAARQMRDAAVKVCREHIGYMAEMIAEAIAALPVPEVQWRDLTDEEIADVYEEHWLDHARAVIAKFKEKNK